MRTKFHLGKIKNVLKMDGYDGCRAMTILNATELYIHKASVMVCVFSHN